ncbi:hypothetical protein NDU88_002173 [Pleurodeles waltl]|uniref:Reverse transcriptase domain-containing protein n=1 Tax=Pleurodeles waltl TaxID=8319 RepID=A0AAV7VBR7_PLEWA|nr:hypothetical protein NDU88_002173 [Pleurodeles waltl]
MSRLARLPMTSKIMEKLVNSQVSGFLEKYNSLHDTQMGFRPFHSTELALLAVTEDARRRLDGGGYAAIIIRDLSAAFDTVIMRFSVFKEVGKEPEHCHPKEHFYQNDPRGPECALFVYGALTLQGIRNGKEVEEHNPHRPPGKEGEAPGESQEKGQAGRALQVMEDGHHASVLLGFHYIDLMEDNDEHGHVHKEYDAEVRDNGDVEHHGVLNPAAVKKKHT